MSDWIPINPDNVKTVPAPREGAAVHINLFLSPYDVPEAVRGRYDQNRKKFVIDFQYASEEPTRQETVDDKLSIRLGKHSGRLYEIEVDVDRVKAKSVTLVTFVHKQVESALENLRKKRVGNVRDNFSVVQEVVSDRKDQLFRDLAGVS